MPADADADADAATAAAPQWCSTILYVASC